MFTVYAIVLCIYSLIKEWTVQLCFCFSLVKALVLFISSNKEFLAIFSSQQELTFLMFKYFRLLPECMHLWLQNNEVFFEERTLIYFRSSFCSSEKSYRCNPLFCRELVKMSSSDPWGFAGVLCLQGLYRKRSEIAYMLIVICATAF